MNHKPVVRFAFATFLLFLSIATLAQTPEEKLKTLGLTLTTPGKPMANYVKAVRTGNLLFLAGHISSRADGSTVAGKLGAGMSIEQGYEAARLAALNLISTIKAEVGELSRVRRVVKMTGFVNSAPDFTDQPKVVNGGSDLLVAVFGEQGKHARSAVGMAALPNNAAVELELVVEID